MDDETSAQVARLREEHGQIAAWDLPGHGLLVVGRTRNPRAYAQVVNALRSEKTDIVTAQTTFVLSCVLHPVTETGSPDAAAVKRLFADLPAAISTIFNRCFALSGGDIEELGEG